MDVDGEYLYRGTTMGWLGTHANQNLPMTCTSTDPLVATCFALECLFHGHSIVQFILKTSVERFIGARNHFDPLESAVNINLKPLEIWDHVVHFIDVDDARQILATIGFHEVPHQIYGKAALDDELGLSLLRGFRLDLEQRRAFNRLAFRVQS